MKLSRLAMVLFGLFLVGSVRVEAGDGPAPVKVMSFNIRYSTAPDGENHWNKRKAFLADTIKAFDPDLLGTQETRPDQRDYLADQLPKYGVFAAGREDGKEKGETTAVYWRKNRFEKMDGGHFWLSPNPDEVGVVGWDAALPRMATWVKLRDRKAPDAKPLFFLNTHFDHKGKKARVESAKLFRRQIDKLSIGCALIMTGDFNSGEGSEPYQNLFGKYEDKPSPLVDTYRVAHPSRQKNEGTGNGFSPKATTGARIDWIGCSRDWTVQSAAIDRTIREGRTPSDHFAVTAVLKR